MQFSRRELAANGTTVGRIRVKLRTDCSLQALLAEWVVHSTFLGMLREAAWTQSELQLESGSNGSAKRTACW